jgi:hypothetical protein
MWSLVMTTMIKEVGEIDQRCVDSLTEAARDEFYSDVELRTALLERSTRICEIWVFGLPVGVVGLLPLSFIGGGNRIWFLPCKGMQIHPVASIKALRNFYKQEKVNLSNVTAFIKLDELPAQKFARLFCFEPSGETFDGYQFYRMRT